MVSKLTRLTRLARALGWRCHVETIAQGLHNFSRLAGNSTSKSAFDYSVLFTSLILHSSTPQSSVHQRQQLRIRSLA